LYSHMQGVNAMSTNADEKLQEVGPAQ